MNHFKTFMLGMGVAFGIYYITRRRADGGSVLDDILENPEETLLMARDKAIEQAVDTIKEKIS